MHATNGETQMITVARLSSKNFISQDARLAFLEVHISRLGDMSFVGEPSVSLRKHEMPVSSNLCTF